MDAEGSHEFVPCPRCGDRGTVTFHYSEGFDELECGACGYRSDAAEITALTRFGGELLEGTGSADTEASVPIRALKA